MDILSSNVRDARDTIEIGDNMSKTKNISLTIDEELLAYVDELAAINDRSRSSMISWMIRQQYDLDSNLDREAQTYESNYS